MKNSTQPIAIATWEHGYKANIKAYETLTNHGTALDAIELGINETELDPTIRTVGYGGYTDHRGEVTLDACIMDHLGNAGSVVYLKDIKKPISVARKIMENSQHVMLAGNGAQEFALKHGFKKENILHAQSKADWTSWIQNKPKLKITYKMSVYKQDEISFNNTKVNYIDFPVLIEGIEQKISIQ